MPAGAWRVDAWLGELRAAASVEVAPGEISSLILELAPAQAAVRSGRLAGRVLDAETGSPIVGATVELPGRERWTLTGSDGGFSFPSLEPGDMAFHATRIGYAEAEGRVTLAPARSVEVEVRLATHAIARGPGETPVKYFGSSAACGAILIWTLR